MVFCNETHEYVLCAEDDVTILILIDGFLQYDDDSVNIIVSDVTILILIDGFLQLDKTDSNKNHSTDVTILILIDGFLQYSDDVIDIIFEDKSQSLF